MHAARLRLNDALASVFEAAEGSQLSDLAAPLVRAENVWILSGETSQAGAHALHSGLSMVRPGVRWLEEHSYGTDLSDAGPKDTAIVFDFFRYRKQVLTAAKVFAGTGATIVAITDSPL